MTDKIEKGYAKKVLAEFRRGILECFEMQDPDLSYKNKGTTELVEYGPDKNGNIVETGEKIPVTNIEWKWRKLITIERENNPKFYKRDEISLHKKEKADKAENIKYHADRVITESELVESDCPNVQPNDDGYLKLALMFEKNGIEF